jgi:D-alanine-D-alanine ligase
LAERIQEISENYSKEVLVEEFIDGREFTVAILGNKNPRVLPIIEQKFDFLPEGMHHIASFELKWVYEDALKNLEEAYTCPANLTEEEKRMIEDTTVAVFGALNCVDCSRVDYRMNRDGKLYFIEINSLPGLNPDPKIISYFRLSASAAGMSFDELIAQILSEAISRYPHLS